MPRSRPSGVSALGRFLRLGSTGARIAGNLMLQGLTPGKAAIDWQPVGDLLADVLGQMKGPVLKLGQQASQWQGVLPEPIREALTRLQNRVPALPFSALEEHLQHLYEGELHQLFRRIETQPCAAASLGQVHRARDARGRALVLKIQYPGIRDICVADLRQLRRLLPLGRVFRAPAEQLEALYDELHGSIHAELDYQAERISLQRFCNHFEGWPGLRLPQPVPELCRPGVLVLHEVPGHSMAEVSRAPTAMHERLALSLCDWLGEQVFGLGLLHADPHPGNLLVDAKGRIVLLDFGMVIDVSVPVRKALFDTIIAAIRRDADATTDGFFALGMVAPGTTRESMRDLVRVLLDIAYQDSAMEDRARAIADRVMRELFNWPIVRPGELVYFARTAALIEGVGARYARHFNSIMVASPVGL
jgi:predicted unusual protein kinase regulating ubiquinone biosynthesis (AarF/ABC1/UbiB family)